MIFLFIIIIKFIIGILIENSKGYNLNVLEEKLESSDKNPDNKTSQEETKTQKTEKSQVEIN